MSRIGDLGPGFLTRVDRLEGDTGSAWGDALGAAAGSCTACTINQLISYTCPASCWVCPGVPEFRLSMSL